LNYYNSYHSNKDCKTWAINYLAKDDKKLKSKLDTVPDYEFHTLGALTRIISNGSILEDKELRYIKNKTAELTDYVPSEIIESKPAVGVTPNIHENIRLKTFNEISTLEDEIDKFIKSGYSTTFQFTYSLTGKSPAIIKGISIYLQKLLVEIKEVLSGSCDQLNESYSKVSKAKLKAYAIHIEKMITSCSALSVTPKAKPAKKNVKAKSIKTKTVKSKSVKEKPTKTVVTVKEKAPAVKKNKPTQTNPTSLESFFGA